MKWTRIVALALALAAVGIAPARAQDAKAEAEDVQNEVFDILKQPQTKEGESSVGKAVDPLDRVIQKSRLGEREAVNSNLDYNQRKIKDLHKQAAAQKQYLETLWERVAVQFEDLKAQFGGDETSSAYRKAALALKEEYEQRESQARHRLDQLNEEIARAETRILELSNRKRMNELEDKLRHTDLRAMGGETERPALPSRASGALAVLSGLSRRKVDGRIAVLVGSARVRSSADNYFDRQINHMLSKRK